MNIIVLVIDTLRYDYIGANGNSWIQTPNLDRLAADSWVFDRCLTASYATIPHRTDLITGRYGGPFHPWRPLPFDRATVPGALGEAGYCTQLLHDTPHMVNGGHNFDWPFHAWTFVRGAEVDRPWIDNHPMPPEGFPHDPVFDFMQDVPSYPLYAPYFWANRHRNQQSDWNAANLFLTGSRWLKDNASRDNFFLWMDCFDPHEPWDVPPEYVLKYDKTPGYDGRIDPRAFWVYRSSNTPTKAAEDRLRCLFAAKVSWMDHWLGEFLHSLDQTGLMRNTAVVLTADHGTNVGERSIFGKQYPMREQEGHIPLIVRTPDGDSGRSGMIVQPQDISATVLSIAGLKPASELDGQDVLAAARRGSDVNRQIALSARAAGPWWQDSHQDGLFTVFDSDWYLEFSKRAEDSRLTRFGSLDDVAGAHQDTVEGLRAKGLREIERRGIDPALLAWLASEGESPLPADCRYWDGWQGPAGYRVYFAKFAKSAPT